MLKILTHLNKASRDITGFTKEIVKIDFTDRLLLFSGVLMIFTLAGSEKVSAAEYFIESDPIPFLYKGSNLTLAVSPEESNLVFWMARFEMEVPDDMIALNKNNAEKGFTHSIDPSLGFAVDYNLNSDLEGHYFGGGVFHISNTIGLEDAKAQFDLMYTFARYGYRFFLLIMVFTLTFGFRLDLNG